MSAGEYTKAVLIAGGYGVVGKQVAELLRSRNPKLKLIIAGRDKNKAEQVAAQLGNADAVAIDVNKPQQIAPLAERLAAVVTAVNDPQDDVLVDTLRQGIAYVDITRWTSRLRKAVLHAAAESLSAPVVFSSAWMAGVTAIVARMATKSMTSVQAIDIGILYSLADKAGPNSVDYVDQLATPFEVVVDGQIKTVKPMTDPVTVTFPRGISAKTYRFDTPDQLTLPLITGAGTVSARIAYDDKTSAGFLSLLVRSGIWKILSLPIFNNLRRSLLYNPGEGGAHEIVISVKGRSKNQTKVVRATLVDPLGQTHLTALGCVIQVERVLGLHGNFPMAPGISFPERHESPEIALKTLREHGVRVEFEVQPLTEPTGSSLQEA